MKDQIRLVTDNKGIKNYKLGYKFISLDEISGVRVVTPYGTFDGFMKRVSDSNGNYTHVVELLNKEQNVLSVDTIMNLRGYYLYVNDI